MRAFSLPAPIVNDRSSLAFVLISQSELSSAASAALIEKSALPPDPLWALIKSTSVLVFPMLVCAFILPPYTCNLLFASVVPMPTLPADSIRALSLPPVTWSFAVGVDWLMPILPPDVMRAL